MRYIRYGQILLVITLGVPFAAWGQGGNGRAGRAAAAAQQGAAPATAAGAPAAAAGTPAAAAAGRGGRGGGAPVVSTSEFYDYDTSAASAPFPDSPPTETHQKITLNGEALAYTARV